MRKLERRFLVEICETVGVVDTDPIYLAVSDDYRIRLFIHEKTTAPVVSETRSIVRNGMIDDINTLYYSLPLDDGGV